MSASTPSVTGVESDATASLQQRLCEQLQALSQVGELLTLRLLELEERLERLEQQLGALEPGGKPASTVTGALLEATAERITRLEELLSGTIEPGSDPGHAPSGAEPEGHNLPRLQAVPHADDTDHEPELELNPFPDDEEQPFMDELSA